jgi:hypothetical protein
MPSVGFEPAIPASERPQTHALVSCLEVQVNILEKKNTTLKETGPVSVASIFYLITRSKKREKKLRLGYRRRLHSLRVNYTKILNYEYPQVMPAGNSAKTGL